MFYKYDDISLVRENYCYTANEGTNTVHVGGDANQPADGFAYIGR